MPLPSSRRIAAGRALAAHARRLLGSALVLAAAASCGDGTGPKPGPGNPVPTIGGVNPSALLEGSDSVTVTVNGAGFVSGSVVRLNGTARPTVFASATQLTTVIPASAMAQAGTLEVTVFNPAPGGGASGAVSLPVNRPAPSITVLDPSVATLQGGPFHLTVSGAGFSPSSIVRWNGQDRPTNFVNPGRLNAHISAADVQAAGTAQVTVFSPAPGGGVSNAVAMPVQNRAPVLTSVNPAVVPQGSVAFSLGVLGSGFIPGSVVRWNGQDRPTTYMNPGQLLAQISAADVAAADTVEITIFTPAPGGGVSGTVLLPVINPAPLLTHLNPGVVMQGEGDFVIQVTGAGFTPNSVVRWNGQDRPTTFAGPGHLTVQIFAADVAAVDTAEVVVVNPPPGGGTSGALPFVVILRPNPTPVLAAISPNVTVAEVGASFTLTGSGFMVGSVVTIGGFQPDVTIVSPTELRFALAAENVPNAGFAEVSVTNPAPGGGLSNRLSLRVENPAPVLTSLSPATATAGADSQVVRLTGSGFVRGSAVWVGFMPRVPRRISATELEIVLTAGELQQATSYGIYVTNAEPGGGTSATRTLTVQNPVPTAQAVSPSQAAAGQDSLVVRVTGSNFVQGSTVHFEGSARPTRPVGDDELEAVLTATDLEQVRTAALTVVNPAPGGGTSPPVSLVLVAPVPVLSSLPSNGASAGRPGYPLVVHGEGFLRSSVVQVNGTTRSTRYISSTRLETNVTSADVASPGRVEVTVHTPGGGTSAVRQIVVRTPGSTAATSVDTVALPAADMVYDSRSARIYASIPASPQAGVYGNTVVAIDPATGQVTGQVGVGSNPGVLALSDDGSTLWVALNGSGSVRRLSLPGLTPGLTFSLNGNVAEEMKVMPGRPGTVAISLSNTCCSPRHEGVAVYDEGVRRSQVTGGHTGSNSIVFGESSPVLYGYNTETTEFGFRTLAVTASGVTETRTTRNLIDGFGVRIRFAQGRVYSTGGEVLDAGRHERAGTLGPGGADVLVDAGLGRAFFSVSGQVVVYDLNTFQQLGTVSAGAMGRLVRWGANGLAVSDGTRIILIRTPIAGT